MAFSREEKWLMAVTNGDINRVKEGLTRHHIDPTIWHNAAIKQAIANCRTEIAKLLLTYPQVNPLDYRMHEGSALHEAGFSQCVGVARILLADPRVNPTITPERAKILNSPTFDLRKLIIDSTEYSNYPVVGYRRFYEDRFLESVNRALDIQQALGIQQIAKNLHAMQLTERHGMGSLPNNVRTHIGKMVSGKVGPNLQSQINQLKGNYHGILKINTRQTRKARKARKARQTRKNMA